MPANLPALSLLGRKAIRPPPSTPGRSRATMPYPRPLNLPAYHDADRTAIIEMAPLGIFSRADCLDEYPKPLMRVDEYVPQAPVGTLPAIIMTAMSPQIQDGFHKLWRLEVLVFDSCHVVAESFNGQHLLLVREARRHRRIGK